MLGKLGPPQQSSIAELKAVPPGQASQCEEPGGTVPERSQPRHDGNVTVTMFMQ